MDRCGRDGATGGRAIRPGVRALVRLRNAWLQDPVHLRFALASGPHRAGGKRKDLNFHFCSTSPLLNGYDWAMEYRREIDGLRALAVIPVILFHAGFTAFSGGFVGVDVFFVISGYLITSIILAELEQGTFTVVNSYERRARRILPALFVVMVACLPFAWFWLRPGDTKDFSQSIAAVSLFSSNILFWTESGYFDAAAELKPLLHTWSLAVEEQYYVLFPLFLMALWAFRKRWILGALIAVGMGNLATAQWGPQNDPSAAFSLLPTRAWEW